MKQQREFNDFTIVLEPFEMKGKPYLAIKCDSDLWLNHHLSKLPGVRMEPFTRLLIMPNLPIQVRRLLRHVKGYGYWVVENGHIK